MNALGKVPVEQQAPRYAAFISYNHRDRAIASWLHKELETYRIPPRLQGVEGRLGVIGARLPPIFQDREELASSADLAKSVRDALEQAATLIVICSPHAVMSRWVNEEIRAFRALGRAAHIQCLIVNGEPHASRNAALDPALECFPPALFEDVDFEPLAADLRPQGDGKKTAKLKLLAGILGVGYNELRDRETERNNRRLRLIATASLAGFALTAGLAVFALVQRSQAIAERDIARQKTMTAERTVDFVKSMFMVADPSEAKGEEITAREVLDRASRRMAQSLNDEPTVKAELTTTLSEVYGSLGLFRQSDDLIKSSFRISGRAPDTEARQLAALGQSQIWLGHYDKAVVALKRSLTLARNDTRQPDDLVSRILARLSKAQSMLGDIKSARTTANEAEQIERVNNGTNSPTYALALEALGETYAYDNQPDQARALFERAVAVRTATQGALHPRVTEGLDMLGALAYMKNEPAVAERYYRRVLANDRAVFGPGHPETATTMNSLGRVLLEQRKFAEAAPLLEQSVALTLAARGETHDKMAFNFANLALAKRYTGDLSGAEALFRRALRAATMHKHRNTAPVMADLAELLCTQGRAGEAMPMLTEARPLMAKTYPDDKWRVAWVDAVRGGCLIASGQRSKGAALIANSAELMKTRWPAGSLYGASMAEKQKMAGLD